MKIEDVITEVIVAIYSIPTLSKLLILKGGSAMRLFDDQTARLSIDADFSIEDMLTENDSVFPEMKRSFEAAFSQRGFDLIDFQANRKPKKVARGFPEWWGGWACDFKLVDRKHRNKTKETRRRNALIPEGSNSSRMKIDLSEHEYCGKRRTKTIRGSRIQAYSSEMIVLEKLRAICQQHPEYPYRQKSKNRARDFYDIHCLTVDASDAFIQRCQRHLKAVFEIKEVPLSILGALWDDDAFVDGFRRGFNQVKDTVRGRLDAFDVYLEHARFLIQDICPDMSSPTDKSIRG
jgi:predicted nucleotidyltransferase component of viral defense system